jgi:hypothetical protein
MLGIQLGMLGRGIAVYGDVVAVAVLVVCNSRWIEGFALGGVGSCYRGQVVGVDIVVVEEEAAGIVVDIGVVGIVVVEGVAGTGLDGPV